MELTQITPSKEQLAALLQLPQDQTVVMINILRYRDQTQEGESGQEVYARYAKNIVPLLKKAQAKLIWNGDVQQVLIGSTESAPQQVFLVEYPSVRHFMDMIGSAEYQAISRDRSMALEYGGLFVSTPARF